MVQYSTQHPLMRLKRTKLQCVMFSKHLDSCTTMDCNDCKLVQYLKEYLMSLQHVEGGELDKIDFPSTYPRPDYGDSPNILGKCNGGAVYLTSWMGLECATKVIDICSDEHASKLWKEASILGGLNHPNIIKFICCGFREVKKQFELVMELGIKTLSQHLDAQAPLEETNVVDIMLQLANGMCYLHDMKVAHRDLKPGNVVVTPPNDLTLINLGCIHVKLLDFGISKVEVKDSAEVPTGEFKMGSVGYMAPEAMAKQMLELDALKADVFSFGMMCSDILSGEKPSFGNHREYQEYIQESKRPKLPKSYSEGLRSIVHDCWSLDPSRRPTFLDIHSRLTGLKSTMLKDGVMIGGVTNDRGGSLWTIFLSFLCFVFLIWIRCLWSALKFKHFNTPTLFPSAQNVSNGSSSNPLSMKVNNNDNMKEFSKLIGVQEKVFQLERQLQSVGCLGIVGMGGIGKSTLAKALSDLISKEFDATCFVSDLEDERCTFQVTHKSKDLQNSPPPSKTLTKTQEILEDIQKTKRILIVVDNVSKQSQLQQLLGTLFKSVNGSKLIASSRDWNSLEQYVPMVGKIDMPTLSGNQPMQLFSMHAFGTNQSCLPHLKHVVEKIVDACCGLPLSLEVMGTCMQGETRLRIWERALHRLLRARHDGVLDAKIWKTLKISFDELKNEEKKTFLEIACFFCKDEYLDVYPTKESYLRMVDGDIDIAKKILKRLQEKSLLKVNDWECFYVHDQLRDMGRMIIEKDFAGTQILDLSYPAFANHCKQKDIELIEGLSIKNLENKSMYERDVEMKSMEKLRLFKVRFCDNIDLLFAIVKKSPNLRWLDIHFSTHQIGYIRVNDHFIRKYFNDTLENLQNLRYLAIKNCNLLGSISCEYFNLMSIRELSFSHCEHLDKFLTGVDKLVTLEELFIYSSHDLEGSFIRLTNLSALEKLHFSKCGSLKTIPEGFGSLTNSKYCACGNAQLWRSFLLD